MPFRQFITAHKIFTVAIILSSVLGVSSIAIFANKSTSNRSQLVKSQVSSLSSQNSSVLLIPSISESLLYSSSSLISSSSQLLYSSKVFEPIMKNISSEIITPKIEIIQELDKILAPEVDQKTEIPSAVQAQTDPPKQQTQTSSQFLQVLPAQNTNQVIAVEDQQSKDNYATIVDAPNFNSKSSQQTINTGCGNNCQTVTIETSACYYTNTCPKPLSSTSISICSATLPIVCATVETVGE